MTVKPNKNLKAMLEKNDAFRAKFEQKIHGSRMMQFMNAWADVYADNPENAWAFLTLIKKERKGTGAVSV